MSQLKAGIVFLVLLCVTACGRQVVEFGEDAGISTAPTVISTTPVNGATGVAVDTLVSATFSRAMAGATIGATTFTVSQGASKVAGAVTLDAQSNTATFTPAVSLNPSLIYTATVSNRVEDTAGVALAANHTWRFTTGAGVTDEPPTVIATTPSAGASDVSPDTHPSATFSEAMDPSTITVDTFLLLQGSTPISGSVTFDLASNRAIFVPDTELELGLVYTATISSDAEDSGGTALAKDYVWTFTTSVGVDLVPPTVISALPANDATGVPLDAAVSATFSEAMNPATIVAAIFTLKRGTTNVPGAVDLDALTNTATFTPAAPLLANTVYTATVSTGAKDLAGNPLATSYSWSFTTATNAAPPTVIATSPVDSATNVPVNFKLTATFSKAMDPLTISGTTFTLRQGATNVVGAVILDVLTNTAAFTPAAPLLASTVYTATISTGAKDLGGTALAANYGWSFTTAASAVAPTVTATTPINLATNVPINVKPTATFSRAMDPTTISTTTFTLAQNATNVVGVVSLDVLTNIATFTATAALLANTVYTATISTGAKDLGGTALAANYSWSFTTAVAPTITATTPVNLATNVPINVKPTATFGKAMDPTTIIATTFTLARGAANVVGLVSLDALTNIATFTPAAPLLANTVYTATISTAAKDLGGTALAANYSWSFTTAAAPTITSTTPFNLATNVPINVKPTATFSRAMDPTTISATTFTLAQGASNVVGLVSLDALTNTATFTPTLPLLADTVYTATISTAAKDLGGTPLAASYSWSFTTAVSVVAPTVISTTPSNLALGVSINTRPTATFSTPMDSATITNLTFTLKQGLLAVAGSVTFNALTKTAVFTPNSPLAVNLSYTATITTGAKDLGGTALAADYTWSFTTAACSQAPVVLGAASGFVALAGSTVTNTGPTVITGDLGVSPGTAVTGFPPGIVIGSMNAGNPTAAQGIAALTLAYNDAAGRTLCPVTVAGNLGGQTLAPGLYKSTSSLAVSSGDLTLDAQGQSDAIFVFQMATTLTTTAGRQVILTNGAKAANIYWQVGTSATLGSTSVFQGTIMADQAITLNTGATLNGRALARIAAINLDSNTIVTPLP